jgi:hypothetical protein
MSRGRGTVKLRLNTGPRMPAHGLYERDRILVLLLKL